MKLELSKLYNSLVLNYNELYENGSLNNVQFIYLKLQMMFTSKDSSLLLLKIEKGSIQTPPLDDIGVMEL